MMLSLVQADLKRADFVAKQRVVEDSLMALEVFLVGVSPVGLLNNYKLLIV